MPTAHAKTPAVTPVPEPRGATPYLTIKGASDAIAFYQRVFGAELLFRIDDPSGGPASVGTDGELEVLLVFTR